MKNNKRMNSSAWNIENKWANAIPENINCVLERASGLSNRTHEIISRVKKKAIENYIRKLYSIGHRRTVLEQFENISRLVYTFSDKNDQKVLEPAIGPQV